MALVQWCCGFVGISPLHKQKGDVLVANKYVEASKDC